MGMQVHFDIQQQQRLSPRLQQSIRLLQLCAQDFEQELRDAVESNPFLEDCPENPVPGNEPPVVGNKETVELAEVETADPPAEGSPDPLVQLEADSPGYDGERSVAADRFEWLSKPTSLREQLCMQLGMLRIDEEQATLARAIIESLDDDGYLRDDLDELAQWLSEHTGSNLTVEELERALDVVQSLEPAGVGARSIAECLAIQLRADLDGDASARNLALHIVEQHMAKLGKNDIKGLVHAVHRSPDEVAAALRLIRRLDPKPGLRVAQKETQYVVPEIIVSKRDGRWTAELNQQALPRASMNASCVRMFQNVARRDGSPLSQQLQAARLLLRHARQRFTTILRVAQAIVRRQRNFMDYGDVALTPMTLRDIAQELGLHESTISRATNNKYMATPHGVLELRTFFSREMSMDSGGICSAAAIRALIREMIDEEVPADPLSDVQLTEELARQGIVLARRTVTKYRRAMKISPAELRRRVPDMDTAR